MFSVTQRKHSMTSIGDKLVSKIEKLVSYTAHLERVVREPIQEPTQEQTQEPTYDKISTTYVCRMLHIFQFPTLDNVRVTRDNVSVGDIIHCNSGGTTIFCRVTKCNPTVLNVDDLEMKLRDNFIYFYKTHKSDSLHKGTLGYTRKMFLLDPLEYTI